MAHFVGKVQKIHASTMGADAMITVNQSSAELSTFQSVTGDQVLQLLRKASNKCIGNNTKAATRQSLNCIKNKK